MKTTLTGDQVATLLRISPAILAQRAADGTLGGFVRINGDEWISSHAAATLMLEGKWDARKQAECDYEIANSMNRMHAESEQRANVKRAAERATEQAAAHQRWILIQEREEKNRRAFGDSIAPKAPPRVAVRSMEDL